MFIVGIVGDPRIWALGAAGRSQRLGRLIASQARKWGLIYGCAIEWFGTTGHLEAAGRNTKTRVGRYDCAGYGAYGFAPLFLCAGECSERKAPRSLGPSFRIRGSLDQDLTDSFPIHDTVLQTAKREQVSPRTQIDRPSTLRAAERMEQYSLARLGTLGQTR